MLNFAFMANKLKSSNPSKKSGASKLAAEKLETVEVKKLVHDERTHKILGAALLLLSFFLFVAFSSYLTTWNLDQDKVFQYGIGILKPNRYEIANLLGAFGAYVSHLFFFKGFGISSYLFCAILFVLGVNLMTGKKIFSVSRNLRYTLTGLLFFSVAFAFVMHKQSFPWGGEVGNMISDWLKRLIGTIGTAAVLLIAGLAYFIWRFNPVFNMPTKRSFSFSKKRMEIDADNPIGRFDNSFSEEAKLFVEDRLEKGNTLKGSSAPLVTSTPAEDSFHDDIKLVERDDSQWMPKSNEIATPVGKQVEELKDKPVVRKPVKAGPEPELQIKPLHVDEGLGASDEPARKVEKPAPYDPVLDLRDYRYPSLDLLEAHGSEKIIQDPAELETNKNQIINTLKNYDIAIQKIYATVGPTVTLYEIVPAAGVRISRIKNLEDDIALSLAALGIRIIAPIPGKGTIGIEVPNVKKTVVSMRGLLASEKFQHNNFSLPIAIGKKIDNENFIVDLTSMPHLLMAGATGQGKSVGLNAILVSLLYKKHPSQLKFVLVDPKKVELSLYRVIEKHFLAKLPGEEEAIITDTKKVVYTLNALCIEMDNRYDLLKEAGCRNIREYNEKFVARKLNPEKGHQYLPFIVLVIDEFADLIMTAGKEIEMPIARLAQLARAVGIHLIIATQRPSVNIITGTIKANFPARIAFKVSSKVDSRTILDVGGAEQLIGKGDMLISYNGDLTRLQCAFVDTPEVDAVVDFIGEQRGYPQAFLLPEYIDEKDVDGRDFDLNDKDPLFEDAARLIVTSQVGSTSLLQRRMKLGYNRAGRLMDQLEAAGIVGSNQGSKARDVLIKTEMELEQHLQALG